MSAFLKRCQSMIILSIFFFYLGCIITVSLIKIDCTSEVTNIKHFDNTSEGLDSIQYAVLIISSPENEIKRDSIRATWANLVNNILMPNGKILYKWNCSCTQSRSKHLGIIKTYFAIGIQDLEKNKVAKLILEHSKTNDLLLLDNHIDTYSALASKMLHSLKWMSKYLKELKYVIKCDDDSFVRIDLIVRELDAFGPEMNEESINKYISRKESQTNNKGLYWGYFSGQAPVYKRGKWREENWFLCDQYLPYALGAGYVISRSIVDYIVKNSDFLSCYNSEDVSMGVWTAALDNINRIHDIRFDAQWYSRGCESNMLVRPNQTPSEILQMFQTLVHSRGRKLCQTDYSVKNFYKYNWNVSPKLCCNFISEEL